MKKFVLFSKITILSLFLISLFVGCSNLADSDDSNDAAFTPADSSKGALKINLGKQTQARFIKAFDFSLSNFSTWTCAFKDENDSSAEEISISTSDSSGTNVPSLSYKDEILTADKIPAGKYTVTIEGTYTPASSDGTSSTYLISGSKSGVEIAQGKTASAAIFVGMKKTSSGKGGISLTLTDKTGKLTETNYGTIFLCDLSSGDVKYSTAEKTLTAAYSDNGADKSSTLTITGENIASGWYKIAFYFDDSVRIYVSSDNAIIEIADGITTTESEITLYATETKTYYASNGTTANGNGLAALSRINLSTLLENLTSYPPDEGEIDIYVNGTPEIDLDKFAALKTKIAEREKSIYIYNSAESTETAAISMETTENSDSTTFTTNIAGALTLTAGTETTLDASTITVDSDSSYTITLANGAALNVTGDISSTLSGTLGICAVVSTGSTTTDNFSAYISNPFITTTSSISDKIKLYEYGNTETSSFYDVNENASGSIYSYYVSSKAGNIVLADGSFVAASEYSKINESNPPIAIVAGINDSGNVIGIGLHISENELAWATKDTTGYKTLFKNIAVNNTYSTSGDGFIDLAVMNGDNDGSDNWEEICTTDENASENAETNYPAFYWANTYSTTYKSYLGNVTSGWYMPSVAELCIVYKNRESINAALSTINKIDTNYATSSLSNYGYWASNQYSESTYSAYEVNFNSKSVTSISKTKKYHVLVVHTLNSLGKTETL